MTNDKPSAYGKLCSLFYDATKKFASEQEVSFYASFMDQQSRVLEAMSGSGRLLIPLLQRGYLVDGVDNSTSMLDRCRHRCAELQLQPQLYEQSLEMLMLPHRYSTITIAVGSFQLIVDRTAALQVLKNIRDHMEQNGDLLMDIFIPDLRETEPSVRMVHIHPSTVIKLTTRQLFYEEHKRVDGYCCYDLIVDGKVEAQEQELISVTWYTDDELRQLLKQAGFALVAMYDETFHSSGPSRIAHARAL